MERILAPHCHATATRCRMQRVVLTLQHAATTNYAAYPLAKAKRDPKASRRVFLSEDQWEALWLRTDITEISDDGEKPTLRTCMRLSRISAAPSPAKATVSPRLRLCRKASRAPRLNHRNVPRHFGGTALQSSSS